MITPIIMNILPRTNQIIMVIQKISQPVISTLPGKVVGYLHSATIPLLVPGKACRQWPTDIGGTEL